MTSRRSVLWLGGVFSDNAVMTGPAISPAANRWQLGLIHALRERGRDVEVVGHRPEPAWPHGDFYVRGGHTAGPGTPVRLSGYLNVYGLRDSILRSQYLKLSRRFFQPGMHPHYVVSYNVYPYSYAVGRRAMRLGIPWIAVVADGPGDPRSYQRLEEALRAAAGCVFLSRHSYEKWTGGPKIHLDGGVSAVPQREIDPPAPGSPKVIFYAGALSQYGGVELLLDAFATTRNDDVKLWICGKGDNAKLQDALRQDTRITFFGCVDEETLRRLSSQAWVMINPRPSGVPGNQHNFPSKVLEYLSYGKPVVSTWTPGIDPEYREVLIVPEEETPGGLARSIVTVLEWSETQRIERSLLISRFLDAKKTWRAQADRLDEWVQSL